MTKPKQTRPNLKKPAQIVANRGESVHSSLGRNAVALETMIAALESLGRLERIDAARVQIARSLAQLVDTNPENPLLWRQYRDAENVLRTVGESAGDDFSDLLRSLDSAVRDEENARPGNARKRGRGDREDSRDSAPPVAETGRGRGPRNGGGRKRSTSPGV